MLIFDCTVRRAAFTLEASFTAPSRGVTALFGRSGAGKSTVIQVLAGLLEPTRGLVSIEGNVLLDTQHAIDVPAQLRALGCVFQDGRLFPHLDVHGNLRYGLRRRRGRPVRVTYESVVELLGLGPLQQRRPHQLSGGERQRVALARALLSQPRALLLDEPLAALDEARKDEVLPYLEQLRSHFGIPIVYVSHAFDEVLRLADHVVVLEGGTVVAAASLAQVCVEPALRRILGAGVVGTIFEGEALARDVADGLAIVRCGNLQLRVSRLPEGNGKVRLYVAADDVAIARQRPHDISIRNIMPARIVDIEPDGGALLVHLAVADARLLARITRSAGDELRLERGVECFALLKAVATQARRLDPPDPERGSR
jgi:molybdate transport system ATP-binding protein